MVTCSPGSSSRHGKAGRGSRDRLDSGSQNVIGDADADRTRVLDSPFRYAGQFPDGPVSDAASAQDSTAGGRAIRSRPRVRSCKRLVFSGSLPLATGFSWNPVHQGCGDGKPLRDRYSDRRCVTGHGALARWARNGMEGPYAWLGRLSTMGCVGGPDGHLPVDKPASSVIRADEIRPLGNHLPVRDSVGHRHEVAG